MARKKISKKIKQEIWAVISIALGVLIMLALAGSLGVAGEWINLFSLRLFGLGVWIFPIVLISIGIALLLNSFIKFSKSSILGILLLFFSIQALLQLSNLEISSFVNNSVNALHFERGGIFGVSTTLLFLMFFGTLGSKIIFTTFFLIGFLITFQLSLTGILFTLWVGIVALFTPKPLTKLELKLKAKEVKLQEKLKKQAVALEIRRGVSENQNAELQNLEPQKNQEELLEKSKILQENINKKQNDKNSGVFEINRGKEEEVPVVKIEESKKSCSRPENQSFSQWIPPSLSLLKKGSSVVHVSDKELRKIGAKIVEKLGHFKIGVEMKSAFVGPTVTQFALKPDETVKLSKITGLKNELALALSAENVRIEAPIVGKNLVGIEIPNRERSTVLMREIINSKKFLKHKGDLRLCLGKDVSGEAQIEALEDMPHLLIAGATGSGKSVGMNSFIISMLYENSPSDLRFIMVDPKRVELMPYEGIPHLLTPVITDDAKALSALRWSVAEMIRRLDDFSKVGARNIKEYNGIMLSRAEKQALEKQDKITKIEKELRSGLEEKLKGDNLFETTSSEQFEKIFQEEFKIITANIDDEFLAKKQWKKIPKIVIIIDELADLMMREHKKETEAMICRIAQMARAVGMHLIIATQRPSVDVITGIIKANIPTRIAFSVTSSIDSRTVIDSIGAEDLLGRGDMLFTNASLSKPKRIQGIYISGEEIEKIVRHLKLNISDEDFFSSCISLDDAPDTVDVPGFTPKKSGNQDDRMEEALEVVRSTGKASASLLQRRLSIGYARAARILDEMEEAGAIGPSKGAKARDIFL